MRETLWPETVSNKYAQNLDYLIACIVYLATSKSYWARTPDGLASDLSLENGQVRRVLQRFPGIFRRSPLKDKKDVHYYSLQARYTLWEASGKMELDVNADLPILPNETLKAILDFIQKMAEHEIVEGRTRRTHTFSVIVALIAGAFAVYAATLKLAPSAPATPSVETPKN